MTSHNYNGGPGGDRTHDAQLNLPHQVTLAPDWNVGVVVWTISSPSQAHCV